ncbi:exodeoxyribonuclease V subunit gamma [Paraferrimonas sedimenticola]|uniref:RecBCD enzyme subunit RecC n=1 Tax=Paraferrimonas sedimenticola TaxID=375674 RepID=A0AA37W058_9GAMM|nr:exodeoxyribonuclease V subunit gamma [Paraferrimonas sedimenticola]GLP98051.1 RecBCD enzyme subunit RecC [Paraferrimonas sedimenticola]
MLKIYQHNLTEQLTQALAAVMADRPTDMPVLQSDMILVQNPDMAQWLKIELAEYHGVLANVEFPMPSSFVWQVFRELFPHLPERSPFGKEQITWQLMVLIPRMLSLSEFAWAKDYFEANQEGSHAQSLLKRFQLCASIADLFDQYLIYRPDWIAQWEAGEQGTEVPAEHNWQPMLWRALVESLAPAEASADSMHRGALLKNAIQILEQAEPGSIRFNKLPSRMSLFGIVSLPEQSMLLLNALARHMDIHWFQVNPCETYWLDIVDEKTLAKKAARYDYSHVESLTEDRYFTVGNPLLGAFGQLGREHLSLMLETLDADWIEDYTEYPACNALGLLQNEIRQLHTRGQFEALSAEQLSTNADKLVLDANKPCNLQFHICYSAMREVESLRDHLLGLMQKDNSIEPNDIMVMVPDVALYAPYIHAVFSGVGDEPRLPYSINDLSSRQQSPIIESLLHLLGIPQSRLTISEVLSILEVPAVLRCFDIDEEEFDCIKHWLEQVAVRWGLDAEHRQQLGVGAFEQNSWYFGLQRLLLGYAMHPEQGYYQGTQPFRHIEGAQAAALGKLIHFVERLSEVREQLIEDAPASAWVQRVNTILNDFFAAEEQEVRVLQQVSEAVERLTSQAQEVEFAELLPFELVREQLAQSLNAQTGSQRFRAGSINFCSLMPMRGIPFKVIALLGMNDGDFPRRADPISFDLMQAKRRRGDRSRRLDDRYLFLEALLSCRQHLYISWVGRDIRDDTEIPPSILVSELRDYIAEAWVLAGDETLDAKLAAERVLRHLTYEHPLQGFNPSYFQVANATPSYSSLWSQALLDAKQTDNLTAFVGAPLFSDDSEMSELNFAQFESFLVHPSRGFMERRLGVYLEEVEQALIDTEPFTLDSLTAWQLKQDAMTDALQGIEFERFELAHQSSGDMPFGQAGLEEIERAWEGVQSLKQHLGEHWPKRLESQFVSVEIATEQGPVRIEGELPTSVNGLQLQLKAGSIKGKDILRAWLRHMLCCASGKDLPYVLLDQKEGIRWNPVTKETANQELTKWYQLYRSAHDQPVLLIPDSGFMAADMMLFNKEPSEIETKLIKSWTPDPFSQNFELSDPYLARCFGELTARLPEVMAISEQYLLPVLEAADLRRPKRARSDKYQLKHSELFAGLEEDL